MLVPIHWVSSRVIRHNVEQVLEFLQEFVDIIIGHLHNDRDSLRKLLPGLQSLVQGVSMPLLPV